MNFHQSNVLLQQGQRNATIVIVGGGTSGWMAANMLAKQYENRDVSIMVIESSGIASVGVGEGSTPFFKQFFDDLGIAEHDWMPACNATYKTGIEFPGWCGDHGPSTYFHPFYSEIDNEQAPVFFAACDARRKGYAAYSHPDDYFVTSHLRHQHKAPVGMTTDRFPANKNLIGQQGYCADYGYHFDAGLLATFLRKHAIKQGVSWMDDKVEGVVCHPNGDIKQLMLAKHGEMQGRFFIDCTGFRGLLIRGALQRDFISLRHRLFCDAAVALPVEYDQPLQNKLPCATQSEAVDNGWIWRIPLTNREGSGLVFSKEFMAPVEAVEQLVRYHGLPFDAAERARHLSWEPGRLKQHWYKNCVAIGLSQGFLEPLEAPMLNITQQSIAMMIEQLNKVIDHGSGEPDRAAFNRQVNDMFDGTCDYLQAHYLLNKRQLNKKQLNKKQQYPNSLASRKQESSGANSLFWQAVRSNPHRSDALNDLLSHWQQGESVDAAMSKHWQSQVYLKTSWYCLFAGLDAFSPSTKPMPQHSQQMLHAAIERARDLAGHFPDHRELLNLYVRAGATQQREYSIA